MFLFFILSGFSIRLSVEKLDIGTKHGLMEYCYRRLRRILPLYWLALAISGAVGLGLAPQAQPR